MRLSVKLHDLYYKKCEIELVSVGGFFFNVAALYSRENSPQYISDTMTLPWGCDIGFCELRFQSMF